MQVWRNLVTAFDGNDVDKNWVRQARQALASAEKKAGDPLKHVRPALDRAKALAAGAHRAEAEKIWGALEELYRNDPGGDTVLVEIRKARGP